MLLPFSPQRSNVTVPLDQFVLREERGILFSGRGHNDLVSWVTVKWLWQRGGSVGYRWGEGNKSKFWHSQSFGYPLFGVARNPESTFLDELAELPRGYC